MYIILKGNRCTTKRQISLNRGSENEKFNSCRIKVKMKNIYSQMYLYIEHAEGDKKIRSSVQWYILTPFPPYDINGLYRSQKSSTLLLIHVPGVISPLDIGISFSFFLDTEKSKYINSEIITEKVSANLGQLLNVEWKIFKYRVISQAY